MITQMRHVGIVVADLQSALSFWCDTLGFDVAVQMDESGPFIDTLLGLEDTKVTTAKLKGPDGNMIELLHFHTHPDKPCWEGTPYSTGLTHIALTVDNIDHEYQRLSKVGVNFLALPQVSADGGAKVAYAAGPEKLLLEFVQML